MYLLTMKEVSQRYYTPETTCYFFFSPNFLCHSPKILKRETESYTKLASESLDRDITLAKIKKFKNLYSL